MPTYCFQCIGSDHPADKPRGFTAFVFHVPKKIINRHPCPDCDGMGRRDMGAELPTQNVTGLTPVSLSTTVKGSFHHETEYAFGRFKRNPDGTEDRNHAAFRDSGEMNAYMNGRNDLGEPALNDKGEPRRRKDGSIVRKGAKLFKYGANATPSRSGMDKRRVDVPSAWVTEKDTEPGCGGMRSF